jgi:2-alkyl-3-oxoalkanoate reductase
MRVLVVGATGFIGGHLVSAFRQQGNEVYALVRSSSAAELDTRLKSSHIVVGSLGSVRASELPKCDAIVYAAGVWRRHERLSNAETAQRCHDVYVRGVKELSAAARVQGAHFVLISGTSRYGDHCFDVPVDEASTPGSLSVFGLHKRKSEAIVAEEGRRGLRWTALVPPEVYGARDAGSYLRFVFERVLARRFFLIGDGENLWSMCNVRNLATATIAAAMGPGFGVMNVADPVASSQRAMASEIARALGRRPRFAHVPRRFMMALARLNALLPRRADSSWLSQKHVEVRTQTRLLDTSKWQAHGIKLSATLAEGIEEAVEWWLAHAPGIVA